MDRNTPATDPDRPRGILTVGDREFLRTTPVETGDGLERQKRYRIRERIRNAFLDFSVIWGYLSEEDTDALFDSPPSEVVEGMTAALSFIYQGTRDGVEVDGRDSKSFESMLKRAIKTAVFHQGERLPAAGYIDVRFENDSIVVEETMPQDVDIEKVGEKIENGEVDDLTHAQALAFLQLYDAEDGLDPDYPRRVRERYEEMGGLRPLLSDEEGTEKKQLIDEWIDDHSRVHERKERAEVKALLDSDPEAVIGALEQANLLDQGGDDKE